MRYNVSDSGDANMRVYRYVLYRCTALAIPSHAYSSLVSLLLTFDSTCSVEYTTAQ